MRLRVSSWGLSFFWVCMIGACFGIIAYYIRLAEGHTWAIVFMSVMFGFCALVSLVFAWACGKYYILTDEGIEHKLCGIRYRTTRWDEIEDIALCELPIECGKRFQGLLISVKGGRVYRPSAYLPRRTKAYFRQFLPDWFHGRLFIIRTHDVSNAKKILPFVLAHYGKPDYDQFKEENKPYSYPKNYTP